MTRLALGFALALALAQALAAARLELTFDEAYYALWARWPQAGYFDHPPLVAWTIRASQGLFGGGELGVRGLFWAMGASLPGLAYALAWRLYGEREVAALAALLFVGAPLAAGAPLATPDTPLVFFWTLALLGLAEVLRGREIGWAVVGLAAGAAGLAKMTAGFLALGVALAMLATPRLRRQFARPGPYGAAALAVGVLSPFLVWNAAHGFATFGKQGGRLVARGFAPRYLAEFVGAQALLFNPLTAAAALRAAAARRGPPSDPTRLLLASLVPTLAYFLLHALHDRVQGNWPAPLYPALAVLAARALAPRWRWVGPAAAAMGLAVTLAIYGHLATGWPALGPGDPALRVGGWRALAAEVEAEARARGAGFVLARGYAAPSLLAFYGGAVPALEDGEPERWGFRPAVPLTGEGLALGPAGYGDELRRRFATVTPLTTLTRRVGGTALETYEAFAVGGGAP